jgi:signal transduction histidine kinase
MTGTNANISERKQVEHMKDEFISTVNHELRTPLTAIMGSLALFRESIGPLASEQSMMLDMAYQNCLRLQTVVNDTLHVEKIASGKMVFDHKPLMLEAFLRRAITLNGPYADRYKVRFELHDVPPGIFLMADEERLMQVLTNLLSNAAKFSPEGEIVVIDASRVTGNYVRVSVTDRGPGVPLEFKNRIFHRFEQADGSNTRQRGGSGLGLSISKAVIEAMGGRINFESPPGKGATFYFEMPAGSRA